MFLRKHWVSRENFGDPERLTEGFVEGLLVIEWPGNM